MSMLDTKWFLAIGVLLSSLSFSGCEKSFLHSTVTEGVIEYALTFPDYDPEGLMAGMLPEKTILTFTEDKQIAELSAGMGVFKTTVMASTPDKKVDYSMSVMSKRLVAQLAPRDLGLFNKESETLTILYTDEVDTIAGYPCKKAIAVHNGIDQPEAEIWYTDAIKVHDPNWYGPYMNVPGMMLRYEIKQYGMRMRLDAISVTPGPVDEKKFAEKTDHDKVSPEVLHHELAEVLSTFTN
jgi:GLPGLI family protein